MAAPDMDSPLADYSGPFEPDFDLGRLSRAALARLGREYMLVGHVQSRVIMPIVATRFGPAAAAEFAIDAWRGASPVFNARNRRLLRIEGDGMSAILKGLQFDVGAPHQYMDFRFELVDETRGVFWLDDCDGLVDDAPRGWLEVLEDAAAPGLDAVVAAVNPRARCQRLDPTAIARRGTRPLQAWSIEIDDANQPLPESPWARAPRNCSIAGFGFRTRLA